MINRFQCPDFFTRFSSFFHVFAEDSIGRKPYFLSIRVLFSTYHTPPGSSYNGHAAAWHLQGPRDVLLASVTNHETSLALQKQVTVMSMQEMVDKQQPLQ